MQTACQSMALPAGIREDRPCPVGSTTYGLDVLDPAAFATIASLHQRCFGTDQRPR